MAPCPNCRMVGLRKVSGGEPTLARRAAESAMASSGSTEPCCAVPGPLRIFSGIEKTPSPSFAVKAPRPGFRLPLQTKIRAPAQLCGCLFGGNVDIRFDNVEDTGCALVDAKQRSVGRSIDM